MPSINEEIAALPKQRTRGEALDMKGRLVLLPRTGTIGVATDTHNGYSYSFVVVEGKYGPRYSDTDSYHRAGDETYPRGGYNISVSIDEMETAVELPVTMPDFGDGTAPPEENFWDDRTTPLAYSEQDSERDLAKRRDFAGFVLGLKAAELERLFRAGRHPRGENGPEESAWYGNHPLVYLSWELARKDQEALVAWLKELPR